MVDALQEAHRILVDRGVFVDARPDSRVSARVRAKSARGTVVGTIGTQRLTKLDDTMSDRAVRDVLRRKLFHSLRRGRPWHANPLADIGGRHDYLTEPPRFSRPVHRCAPTGPRHAAPLRPRPRPVAVMWDGQGRP